MTVPLLLLTVAGLLAVGGGPVLANAAWPQAAPRLAVAMWQALSWAVLSSVVLAGLALALPTLPMAVNGDLADFLGACALALRAQYATPGGTTAAVGGAVLAVLVVARLAQRAVVSIVGVRRSRRHQLQGLAVLGDGRPHPGVQVVRDGRPVVYCLPGRRGRVVVTTGALDRLPADQLTVVLAHERAHLRGRHDLVLLFTAVLASAFPFVPLFRGAQRRVPGLLEMAADDAAVRSGGRHALARALGTLSQTATPVGALGAGGASALARVLRLSQPRCSLGRGRGGLVVLGIVLTLAAPIAIAVAPVVSAAAMDYCPMLFPS